MELAYRRGRIVLIRRIRRSEMIFEGACYIREGLKLSLPLAVPLESILIKDTSSPPHSYYTISSHSRTRLRTGADTTGH